MFYLCESCPSGCFTCYDDTSCSSCYSPDILNEEGQCVRSQCQEGCLSCRATYSCSQCASGYILGSDDQCKTCSNIFKGCTDCDGERSCLSCRSGYTLNYFINDTNCTFCTSLYGWRIEIGVIKGIILFFVFNN